MKPILFNTSMVQAILEGRKTSTRRITKFRPYTSLNETNGDFEICESETQNFFRCLDDFIEWAIGKCRYRVGDILYVRETWCVDINGKIFYRADGVTLGSYILEDEEYDYKWRSSIHMPKSLARIFLKVTDIKVQMLQDITEEEARQEGITDKASYDDYNQTIFHGPEDNYKYGFAKVWRDCGYKWPYVWEGNPWVFVISFKRVEKEE